MIYKKFTLNTILRLGLIFLNLLVITSIIVYAERFFSSIVLSTFLILQLIELFRYTNKTNRELFSFFQTLRASDYSTRFPDDQEGFRGKLYQLFNDIIATIEQAKIEQQEQFHFLKTIMRSIEVGIIAMDEQDNIYLINEAAKKLVNLGNPQNIDELENQNPEFTKTIKVLKPGEKVMIEISSSVEKRNLSVHSHWIKTTTQSFKIYVFQNIRSEIEMKEMEAWNKLIRTLAHEILNSVTPVASLTETSIMLLENEEGIQKKHAELTEDQITKLRTALKTIHKRSDHLLHFIEDYRKLTRLPAPKIEMIELTRLFEHLRDLMLTELKRKGTIFLTNTDPTDLQLAADRKLLEQMLINLIKNSIEAMDEAETPEIRLSASTHKNFYKIQIQDNGTGIQDDKLNHIFTPFFTTKENGSGVGLSLSRQIMVSHKGDITVESLPGKETVFTLTFPKV